MVHKQTNALLMCSMLAEQDEGRSGAPGTLRFIRNTRSLRVIFNFISVLLYRCFHKRECSYVYIRCGCVIQVLDGVSVDAEEVAASKEVYSGRLTAELLEEKIGVWAFERLLNY